MPEVRHRASRPSLPMAALGLAACSLALIAAALLMTHAWSWWAYRSYVPVEALVLTTSLHGGGGQGRAAAPVRAVADFAYRYHGRRYTSSNVGRAGDSGSIAMYTYDRLRAAYGIGSTVTLWVDPARPDDAVFIRDFAWKPAAIHFTLHCVLLAVGLAALTWRSRAHIRPADGALAGADHGAYLFAGFFAAGLNVLAWPLAAIALAEAGGDLSSAGVWPFFACVAGLAMAGLAWRLYEKRRLLGFPLLERLDGGSARFRARVHFRPALGSRCAAGQAHHGVGITVRQVLYRDVKNRRTAQTVWYKDLGAVDVARGAESMDIAAESVSWSTLDDGAAPAYWEVTMRALGSTVRFRIAP